MKCIIGNKKWVCGFRDELKVSQNIIRSGGDAANLLI